MKKGLELPLSTIVVLSLAVLVLVVVASFYLSGSKTMNRVDAQYAMTRSCQNMQCADAATNFRIARTLASDNPRFLEACNLLYPSTGGDAAECMKQCGCAFGAAPVAVQNAISDLQRSIIEHQESG